MRRGPTSVVTAILGGGQGARLWPLTELRAKPAVPLGGKFRLIDVPISNALHAGLDQIYVLTQFNTASLHRHIAQTYRFDVFSRGFVNILAAEQSMRNRDWYQGTADAVRQNLHRLTSTDPTQVVVLSGDQLYLLDLGMFLRKHVNDEADLTIAVQPVPRDEASAFGILQVDETGRIVDFVEKPTDPAELDRLTPPPESFHKLGLKADEGSLLASMGMYVFETEVLERLLGNTSSTDFGREVVPQAISAGRTFAFPYDGYWEDIGTIPAFHRASIELTSDMPPLNLYHPERPIYTHPRFLPGTKINHCDVQRSVLCEGSILSAARVADSIVGIRAVIRTGSVIEETVMMGASHYESEGELPLGVGPNCTIRRAILDLDTRIGEGCSLTNADGVSEADGPNYAIRGGIIVIPKGTTLEPGTVI